MKNLFPSDLRILEVISSLGLLLLGLVLFIDLQSINFYSHLLKYHSNIFWVIFCFTIGGLQLYSIYDYPKEELIRACTAWIAGLFWFWYGLSSFSFIHVLFGAYLFLSFIMNLATLNRQNNGFSDL